MELIFRLAQKGFWNHVRNTFDIKCTLELKSCSFFGNFINAVNNLWSLDLTSSQSDLTAARSYILYLCFLRIHSNDIYSALYSAKIGLRLPEFVHAWLACISIPVKSFTEKNSHINGSLTMNFNLVSELNNLLNKDQQFWINEFRGTKLENSVNGQNFTRFSSVLKSEISTCINMSSNLTKNESSLIEVDAYICAFMIERFKNIIHPSVRDKVPYVQVVLSQGHSTFMGIFRFHNIVGFGGGHYAVNTKSLEGLSEHMLTTFACFVFIFSPTYSLRNFEFPGFEPISFSSSNSIHMWEIYLTSRISKSPETPKRPRNGARINRNANIDIAPVPPVVNFSKLDVNSLLNIINILQIPKWNSLQDNDILRIFKKIVSKQNTSSNKNNQCLVLVL